jgi:hypothetical protein
MQLQDYYPIVATAVLLRGDGLLECVEEAGRPAQKAVAILFGLEPALHDGDQREVPPTRRSILDSIKL